MFTLSALQNPRELLIFVLITFSDLKSYRFTYWLGIPAILPETPFIGSPMQSLREITREDGCILSIELYRALLRNLAEKSAKNTKLLQNVFALYFPFNSNYNDRNKAEAMKVDKATSAVELMSEVLSINGDIYDDAKMNEIYSEDTLSMKSEMSASISVPTASASATMIASTTTEEGMTMVQSPAEYQLQHINIQHAELLTLKQAWPLRHSTSLYFVVSDPASSSTGYGWIVRNLLAMLAMHAPTNVDSAACKQTDTANNKNDNVNNIMDNNDDVTVRIIGFRGNLAKKLFR